MFFSSNKKNEVVLPNDRVFVFCFKNKQIILDENCDYYEYNKKCDEIDDVFNRTHHKHTMSGASYVGDSLSLLNECDYCLQDHNNTKYRLSDEAVKCMNEDKRSNWWF